ncbi:MAG: hypothetical protein WKF70_12720, partial [Chitinophagaceae bacterium]
LTVQAAASVMVSSDFNVAGNFTNNGLYDGSLGALVMTGSTDALITGTTTPSNIAQLVIRKGSGTTVTAAVNLASLLNLNVFTGTLFTSTFNVAEDIAGGLLTVEAGAKLKIGGINTLPAFTSIGLNPLSTVEYAGGVQTIANNVLCY